MHTSGLEDLFLRSNTAWRYVRINGVSAVQIAAFDMRRISLYVAAPDSVQQSSGSIVWLSPDQNVEPTQLIAPGLPLLSPRVVGTGIPGFGISIIDFGDLVRRPWFAVSGQGSPLLLIIETFHDCPCSEDAGITPR